MSEWEFPQEGQMDKPSKIYFQTMTKYDVEERLKNKRSNPHPHRVD